VSKIIEISSFFIILSFPVTYILVHLPS